MRFLLINGSPHKEGTTSAALAEFARILKEEGAESETVQIGNLAIRGCTACMYCKKNGKCVICDTVNEVAERFAEADGIIVASPVYYASPTGSVISFLDRLFFIGISVFFAAGSKGKACRRITIRLIRIDLCDIRFGATQGLRKRCKYP